MGQVHVRDVDGPRRVLDRGDQIERASLAKSPGGRTISWLNDGQRRTAPLP